MRGATGDIIFIDEWSSFKGDKLDRELMPIYRLKDVPLIGISSHPDDPNTMMMRALNSPFVQKLVIEFICADCKKKNIKEKCVHVTGTSWVNTKKETAALSIMDPVAGQAIADVGFYGRTQEVIDNRKCFAESRIEQMFALPPLELEFDMPCVYIGIDPASGSENYDGASQSELAVTSMVRGSMLASIVFTGFESIDVVRLSDEADDIVCNHIRSLLEMPALANATFFIGVEEGTGRESTRIRDAIRRKIDYNRIVFVSDFEKKHGLKMKRDTKQWMLDTTRELIEHDQIRFLKKYVSHTKVTLPMLKQQFKNFERIPRERNTSTGLRTIGYELSGKLTPNTKDDLLVSLMWTVYMVDKVWRDPAYIKYRAKGIR